MSDTLSESSLLGYRRMDPSETIWLNRYKNGDVEALGRLVEHYRKPLYSFIYRMTGDPLKTEEVFQEVWFKAIRKLDTYTEHSLLSWLFRIAHNHLIDLSRKKKPDASLQDPRGGEEEKRTLEDLLESGLPDPSRLLEREDIRQRVAAAVETLPPEQKEVFLMRTEGDLSFKEIAEIQRVSINTALGRMQYALARLRHALQDLYEDFRTPT
jgi:RNA polymerase sigma-70 factor (ECF subfamily)